MITGHFDLALKDAKGLDDAVFLEAMRQKRLPQLLDGLATEAEYHTDNLIFDIVVPYFGYFACGAPAVGEIGNFSASSAYFTGICLTTTDSEPAYPNEWTFSASYATVSNLSSSANTSTGGKFFEEEASEAADIRSDPGGREAVWYRERWLYLPSQGTSPNIRSISISSARQATNSSEYRSGWWARVRIKDGGGNPIIINKTTSQVLLVEYKVTVVSI